MGPKTCPQAASHLLKIPRAHDVVPIEDGPGLVLGHRYCNPLQHAKNFLGDEHLNFYLGQAYYTFGHYPEAIDLLERNVESLQGELLYERFGLPAVVSVYSRTWLVECLAELGAFAKGTTMGEEEVRIAESVNHPFSLAYASKLGWLTSERGDEAAKRAADLIERAVTSVLGTVRTPDLGGRASTWDVTSALIRRLGCPG